MLHRILLALSFSLILFSCSKKDEIYKPSNKINPYELYKEALDAFDRNDYFYANKKFSEAELNFSDVELAAKSAIMASFSLYGINFYSEATENLDRFIKTYPSDKNLIYANYLQAIIYFEQMGDEKKDLKPLIQARQKIDLFIKKLVVVHI